MNIRLRLLRDELNLSRSAFGEKLGVSGDVINNLERGRVEIKDHIVKLICSEFAVNEEWLRTGIGSMYIKPDTFSLDAFVKSQGMSELELEIVKTYFELPKDIRKSVLDHFINHMTTAITTETESVHEQTTEELEDEYKKSVLKNVKKPVRSVSNIIEGKKKKEA